MKLQIVCALALAYTFPCVLGINRGMESANGQFPYQAHITVYLRRGSARFCAGSLIATEWLLTSAHCVNGGNAVTVELAGIRYLLATQVLLHRRYGNRNSENDIALIQIPAVTLTEERDIIQLPKIGADNSDYANQTVTASGWGSMPPIPRHLHWTTLTVLSNENCQNIIPNVTDGMICAIGANLSSVCRGDSGAPLVLNNTKTQVGIASSIYGCNCEGGFPSVFTRITHYLQWIKINSGVFYQ